MANLTDADKVLRNDTGKDIVTQLTAIKTAIENGGGGSGASTVSQLTDVLLSQNIPDGDVLVRDNNLTGGKLWKNATITVELTQAEYNQLVADDDVLPDVNYYITDAPSMQGTSADLSYDGTTTSTYAKISEIDTELSGKATYSEVTGFTLTCPRCPIASIQSSKCYRIGNVIHLSVELTFGAKTEAQSIYFQSSLLDLSDFAFGSLFYDTGDTINKVAKGTAANLWVTNGTTRVLATDVENKSKMFLNVVIVKV